MTPTIVTAALVLILFFAAFICGACRVASAADRSSERLIRELEAEAERAASLADARCPPSHFTSDSPEFQRNHG